MAVGKFDFQEGSKTFVGLSKDGLVKAKATLQYYSAEVDKIINGIVDAATTDAFKGEALVNAVKTFVASVKEEALEWSSQINRYCDVIDTVIKGYETTEQSKLSSLVTESSKSVSSQTSMYKYNGGSGSAS